MPREKIGCFMNWGAEEFSVYIQQQFISFLVFRLSRDGVYGPHVTQTLLQWDVGEFASHSVTVLKFSNAT